MSRAVRVFQDPIPPESKPQPIQRYRPAVKKKGREQNYPAIVLVLNAKDYSGYHFGHEQGGARYIATENAGYYRLYAWDGLIEYVGVVEVAGSYEYWHQTLPTYVAGHPSTVGPGNHYWDGHTWWSDYHSQTWRRVRAELAAEGAMEGSSSEEGGPVDTWKKHKAPVYVLWTRYHYAKRMQALYDEEAIRLEWEALVDTWAIEYSDYDRAWRACDYAHSGYVDWAGNHPYGEPFTASAYYVVEDEINGMNLTTPYPGPYSYNTHLDEDYEFIVKKHLVREEHWVVGELTFNPPKEYFWDTTDPDHPDGKWSVNEDCPVAWGDDYQCWDKEVFPSVAAKWDISYSARYSDLVASGRIPAPDLGSTADDWYAAIGLAIQTDIFGNTSCPESASGEPNPKRDIVLYIDEHSLPSHVNFNYKEFKRRIQSQSEENEIRVLCRNLEDRALNINQYGNSQDCYLDAAHSDILTSQKDHTRWYKNKKNRFRENWEPGDEVWLNHRSFHADTEDVRWFRTAQDALDYAAENS